MSQSLAGITASNIRGSQIRSLNIVQRRLLQTSLIERGTIWQRGRREEQISQEIWVKSCSLPLSVHGICQLL
jgi:hypothetical protein